MAETVPLLAKAERLFEVVPLVRGEKLDAQNAGRLTQAEREFISSFVKPFCVAQHAIDMGLDEKTLKVEFTFANGHRGGLLFRRRT